MRTSGKQFVVPLATRAQLTVGGDLCASEPAEHDAGRPAAPVGALCFRISAEVVEGLPAVAELITASAERWEWPLEVDANCTAELGLNDLGTNSKGERLLGVYRHSTAGILLDREAVVSGYLADISAEECDARRFETNRWNAQLSRVSHELGHALGLPDSTTKTGAMCRSNVVCRDVDPTTEEIAASLRPQ